MSKTLFSEHPRQKIVKLLSKIYQLGLTTASGGNISIKDAQGNIWITPAGMDKGALTVADIVCVSPSGRFSGSQKPSSELAFHQGIYRKRDDIQAIVHAHPPAMVAFSIAQRLPEMGLFPESELVCGRLGYAEYKLTGSQQLGEQIAEKFAAGLQSVLMENHGIICVGSTAEQAFARFEYLELLGNIEIQARKIGIPQKCSSEDKYEINFENGNFNTEVPHRMRQHINEIFERGELQKICFNSSTSISVRIQKSDMLLMPRSFSGIHKNNLFSAVSGWNIEDKLHREIQNMNADINAVIISKPPFATAFAVTDKKMDARIIPESYILLRNIPVISLNAIDQPQLLPVKINFKESPVIMVQNRFIISTGNSLFQAYDRMEVLENCAKSMIHAKQLGGYKKLSAESITELEDKFFN